MTISFKEASGERAAWLTLWTSAVLGKNVNTSLRSFIDVHLVNLLNEQFGSQSALANRRTSFLGLLNVTERGVGLQPPHAAHKLGAAARGRAVNGRRAVVDTNVRFVAARRRSIARERSARPRHTARDAARNASRGNGAAATKTIARPDAARATAEHGIRYRSRRRVLGGDV